MHRSKNSTLWFALLAASLSGLLTYLARPTFSFAGTGDRLWVESLLADPQLTDPSRMGASIRHAPLPSSQVLESIAQRKVQARAERGSVSRGPGTVDSPGSRDLDFESFEDTWPNSYWFVGDASPAGGLDYWGRYNCFYIDGQHSCWCARTGDCPLCTSDCSDCGPARYCPNMDAYVFTECEYLGFAPSDDAFRFQTKTQYATGDYAELLIVGWVDNPSHDPLGCQTGYAASHYYRFNDTGWYWSEKTRQLGSAFDDCSFVLVLFRFHSDGTANAAKGCALDAIEFFNGDDCSISPISGGFGSCQPGYDFEAFLTEDCPGEPISFSASADDAAYWNWTFGDGGTSTEEDPDHVYASPGRYTVTMTAGHGCCSQTVAKTDYITIYGVPPAPTNCVATDNLCGSVHLTWADNSSGYREETGFQIYADGFIVGSVGPNVTAFDDAAVDPGAVASYTVVAMGECDDSPDSNPDNGVATGAPEAPSGCAASENDCAKVRIGWMDNASGYTAESGFRILRDGVQIGTTGANATSYDDLTAAPCQTYAYRVRAYNACGDSPDAPPDAGARLGPPAPPSACAATDDLPGEVRVTWADNASDLCGELQFRIFRDGVAVDSVAANATSYTDHPGCGAPHAYQVVAVNSCGDLGASNADGGACVIPAAGFARADVDATGEVNISDSIYNLAYQFAQGPAPACPDAADDDDSGEINISDPIYSLAYQFAAGSPPPPPFPSCGSDPTGDALNCGPFPPCGTSPDRPAGPSAADPARDDLRLGPPFLRGRDLLEIPILVETLHPLQGAELTLVFDRRDLAFVEVVPPPDARFDFLSGNASSGNERPGAGPERIEGRVRIGCVPSLRLTTPLPPGHHSMGSVRFRTTDGGKRAAEGRWAIEHALLVSADHGTLRIPDKTGLVLGPISAESGTAAVTGEDRALAGLPNPYRPGSTIELALAGGSDPVDVSIYDISGRKLRTLPIESAGPSSFVTRWDGRTDRGEAAGSGIYYLRASSGDRHVERSLLLVK